MSTARLALLLALLVAAQFGGSAWLTLLATGGGADAGGVAP